MWINDATDVDEALRQGLGFLKLNGEQQPSRAGDVLVAPHPVMTVNQRPMNRVSFDPKRNANPFFHLMEAFWMLAGSNDARWLDQFVGDFSSRFAEDDGHMHGAYGFRWRSHFELEGGGGWPDQLSKAVNLLRANPDDRRVVIAMWDPVADLGADKKDIPCNTQLYLRVRRGPVDTTGDYTESVLDMTVCCRSNDIVMGAHGANAVHFSVLQEYLAARIGVGVGKLYQMSNNYHAYLRDLERVYPMERNRISWYSRGVPTKIVTVPDAFDQDVDSFVLGTSWAVCRYSNAFFEEVAVPMRWSYQLWRKGDRDGARAELRKIPTCDWSVAASDWYARRVHKHLEENNVEG